MHAAKREQSPPFAVGRWWGYVNRSRLLEAQDIHETVVSEERERVWWVRLYKRHTSGKVREGKGFSWFLPRSAQTVAFGWIQQRIEDENRETFRLRIRIPTEKIFSAPDAGNGRAGAGAV